MINVRVFDLYAYIKDPVESGRHYSFRYGNSGPSNNAIICDIMIIFASWPNGLVYVITEPLISVFRTVELTD